MNVELLAAHAEPVVRGVSAKSVANYCRLMRWYGERSVADDVEFQRLFAYFYGINGKGLTGEFKQRYFEILESSPEPRRSMLRRLSASSMAFRTVAVAERCSTHSSQSWRTPRIPRTRSMTHWLRVSSDSDRRTTVRLDAPARAERLLRSARRHVL